MGVPGESCIWHHWAERMKKGDKTDPNLEGSDSPGGAGKVFNLGESRSQGNIVEQLWGSWLASQRARDQ